MKLYNNDSVLIFEEALKNYDKEKIIIVTDPPFNINYKYNTYNCDPGHHPVSIS